MRINLILTKIAASSESRTSRNPVLIVPNILWFPAPHALCLYTNVLFTTALLLWADRIVLEQSHPILYVYYLWFFRSIADRAQIE